MPYYVQHLTYICTYIISYYNPSVRITAQLLTSLMLCRLILYVSGGTYSLTSTPNDRFLRNFFMAGLFTLRVFARTLLRGSRQRNIFHTSWQVYLLLKFLPGICWEKIAVEILFLFFSYFGFDAFSWDMNPGFKSNKPRLLFFF